MKQNMKRTILVVSRVLAIALVTLSAAVSARAGEKILLVFNGTDGESPTGTMVADGAGNLYGVTFTGGIDCSPNPGCGVVYKLTPRGPGHWTETILHKFTGHDDGAYPIFLIIDAAGNLYGTTTYGGGRGGLNCEADGCGVVFKLTPAVSGTWPEKILYRFGGGDGARPDALAFDSHGNLYGTTSSGGGGSAMCAAANGTGCGVLFELTPTTSGLWTLTTLHTFLDVLTDGQGPLGLVFGAGDVMYVTTAEGPHGTPGAVFQFAQSGGAWSPTLIHSFSHTGDGFYPDAGVILDAAGNLYGTTTDGGPLNYGVVYELSPGSGGTWTESILYSFQAGTDGKVPQSQLAFDAAGNLYGTTFYGGGTAGHCDNGCGTVFKLTPSSAVPWPESLAIRFVKTNGANPAGGLVLDTDGNLYGTAPVGGASNDGVVFEVTP